jgi:hypothetical protein
MGTLPVSHHVMPWLTQDTMIQNKLFLYNLPVFGTVLLTTENEKDWKTWLAFKILMSNPISRISDFIGQIRGPGINNV